MSSGLQLVLPQEMFMQMGTYLPSGSMKAGLVDSSIRTEEADPLCTALRSCRQ